VSAATQEFRKDINGLRGLAVLAVVLYHFRVPGFDGGYIGVDVFFVISGYLMTQIIVPRVKAGTFSVLDFYLARARRIVPALIALALTLLFLGFFVLSPYEYRALGKHAASAVMFLSNIIFSIESGYFDPVSHEKWLLHTWSLSVEWQFYLLYPLLVLLLAKLGRAGAVTAGLALILLVSLAISVVTTPRSPETAFYLLPARAWEMLGGGLIFLLREHLDRLMSPAIGIAGLLLVLLAMVFYSDATPFPGSLAAVPVVGAGLLIASRWSGFLGRLPFQTLGNISYSLYLWHWPFWVGARHFELVDNLAARFAVIAAAVVVSYLSYRFVETPFRRKGGTTPIRTLMRYGTAMSVAGAAASAIFVANGISYSVRGYAASRDAEAVLRYANQYDYSTPYRRGTCLLLPDQPFSMFAQECFSASGTVGAVLWGDSHAAHLYPALRASPHSIAQLNASACPPFVDYAPAARPHCFDINQNVLRWIQRSKPHTAVLAGYWVWYRPSADVLQELTRTTRVLREHGVRNIVVVGPVPSWVGVQPVRLHGEFYGRGFAEPEAWRGLVREGRELDAAFKRWAVSQDVRYVSPYPVQHIGLP
jgi:peptidoglycan/LPS O-acetylase OafA/YrhL